MSSGNRSSGKKTIINPGGILLHSFWLGEGEKFFAGQRFTYYTNKLLLSMIEAHFEVVEINGYGEFEDGDSIYLVLQG